MYLLVRKYSFVLLFLTSWAYGQHYSKLNRFSIPYSKGCAPVTINITPQDDKSHSYIYEEGLIDRLDTFYTYTVPGTYQIVQFLQEDIVPKSDTLTFTVLDPHVPNFEVYNCGTNTFLVEVNDSYYDYYQIETSSDTIDYLPGNPFPTFTNLTGMDSVNVIGMFNDSYNGCGSQMKYITMSNTLSTANITNAAFQATCGNVFDATLSTVSQENIKYQVDLSLNNGPFNLIYEGPIVNNSLQISDIIINNELDYCLRINTVEPCSNNVQNGSPYCNSLASNTFSFLSNAYASYSGNNIEIQFDPVPAQKVIVKKEINGEFNSIDTLSAPVSYPVSGSNHYRLVLTDTCGSHLDSLIVSPPQLSITKRDYDTNEIEIETVDATNQLTSSGHELVIYNKDSTVVEIQSLDNIIRLSPEIGSLQYLRLRVWYNEISDPVYSNKVSTRYIYRIYVPSAFTPNQDGLNDRLEFFGLSSNVEITIFNRWGQKIHYTDNISLGWNGYINDEVAPEGAYSYEIRFTSPDGEEIQQVGTFALIKN